MDLINRHTPFHWSCSNRQIYAALVSAILNTSMHISRGRRRVLANSAPLCCLLSVCAGDAGLLWLCRALSLEMAPSSAASCIGSPCMRWDVECSALCVSVCCSWSCTAHGTRCSSHVPFACEEPHYSALINHDRLPFFSKIVQQLFKHTSNEIFIAVNLISCQPVV